MRLSYQRLGRGEPLVLIHGIGSRRQVWAHVLDALAAERDVIALDLPGFGASPSAPGTRGAAPSSLPVPALASIVADFLDDLGVRDPAIGGNSLGGGIALELGRRGRASAVTVFSPVGFFGDAGAWWSRAVVTGARAAGAALGPALPPLLATRAGRVALCSVFYGRPGPLTPADCLADARSLITARGFDAARRGLGDWRLDEAMAAGPGPESESPRHPAADLPPRDPAGDPASGDFSPGDQQSEDQSAGGALQGGRLGPDGGGLGRIPVTVAWGSRDLVLPYRQAARAKALLPGARHVRLDGCGHVPFADDPRSCARLLLTTR